MFKVFKDGELPTRGSRYSACVDLYAREDVVIGAGETVLIPLGVCIDVDMDTHMGNRKYGEEYKINKNPIYGEGAIRGFGEFKSSHYLQLMLRSSLSKELIIANGVGVIDLDYSDEIMMRVHNPLSLYIRKEGNVEWTEPIPDIHNEVTIKKGARVAQITLMEHKSYLFGIESEEERKGGFGSSGKN